MTPVSTSPPITTPKLTSDHFILSSLARMPTPTFGSPVDENNLPRHFPLLPPHHPLRKKLHPAVDREGPSPPHTPKGHSIESRLHFPFSAKVSRLFSFKSDLADQLSRGFTPSPIPTTARSSLIPPPSPTSFASQDDSAPSSSSVSASSPSVSCF